MRYCVIKDTIKVIDGSENSLVVMLQNAVNSEFEEDEVEILTEEEYLARVELEPELIPKPTETEMMRDYILDVDYKLIMMELGL